MDAYNDIFGTTAKALDLRSKRMEMISSNIVNADVAGYKSKDIDFKKMIEIVNEFNYEGYLGIEYEGDNLSEIKGIDLTKKLLNKFI